MTCEACDDDDAIDVRCPSEVEAEVASGGTGGEDGYRLIGLHSQSEYILFCGSLFSPTLRFMVRPPILMFEQASNGTAKSANDGSRWHAIEASYTITDLAMRLLC